jgi:hypothetical protein
MQRDPTKMAYGYVQPTGAEQGEQPMSMLEAGIFFAVLSLLIDGISAIIGRATGVGVLFCLCGGLFATLACCAGAGFVGARYTAVVNGVWAGIMVAAINSVFSQLIYIAALPAYREWKFLDSQTSGTVSTGSAIGMVLGVIIGALFTMFGGAFFGFIGAAFSQLGIFRPKDVYYADEY